MGIAVNRPVEGLTIRGGFADGNGGAVLCEGSAPIFRDIARFALQYLEVPPDAPESKRSSSLLAAVSTP